MPPPNQKNIVYGSITAGGDVRIGDEINYITYQIERDFKSGSILFLRLEKAAGHQYLAHLAVKSKHSAQGTLSTSGETWCENFTVDIPQLSQVWLQQLLSPLMRRRSRPPRRCKYESSSF